MAKRRPGRLDTLAVLRGEIDHCRKVGREDAVRALQAVAEILGGKRQPSGPSPSADPGIGRRGTTESAFLKGMMDGP
jgi:hypothetical protein